MARDEPRYAYHAFPRRDRGTRSSTARRGLAVLRSIASSGLLLRPEVVAVPGEILDDGSVGQPSFIGERFGAFTVRTVASLVGEHAHRFGQFAIELDVSSVIEIGALPAFYLPLRDDQHGSGRALTARTAEITVLLERLTNLSRAADTPFSHVELTVSGRPAFSATKADVRDLLSALTTGMRPFDELLAAFQALASLIYPVDALGVEELRFFEQREWRVLSNALDPRHYTAGAPTAEERETLMSIDRSYFGGQVQMRSGTRTRIDECLFLRSIRHRPFLDYARRVIVPDTAVVDAAAILSPSFPGLPVVAFSSVATTASNEAGRVE
jgi:hypothetical protein